LTATGLGDAVPTPILGLDQPIPGVEVHANIYSALGSGTMIKPTGPLLAFVTVALSIALLLGVYSKLRPRWGILNTVLLALFPVLISFLLYRFAGLWYAPLLASLPILLAFPFYDDDLDITGGAPLVDLFENATTHLGLKSWFVLANGKFDSSDNFPRSDVVKINSPDWVLRNGMQVKKYISKSPLVVGYKFENTAMNSRFGAYLDNASRVQKLIELPNVGGTIESLQTNADRLSKQSQRMLQLRVLNDNIFKGSPAGLIVWNSVGELLRHNELAEDMFKDMQLADKTVFDFFVSIGKDPLQIDREAFEAIMLI